MNAREHWRGLAVAAVVISVIAGVTIRFFVARNVKEIPQKAAQPSDGMQMTMPQSGMVEVPAGTRQLIGVRSAPVGVAILGQDIRAVGTVVYDERQLSQVTLKTPGWVREVFVNSIGRPVRKGEPLFTFYSPDLLSAQDEYLGALKTQDEVAASPLDEAKTNAAVLVASARERLRLWDLTDQQIATVARLGKADPVLTIYAPSSGIVLTREAFPGKYVEPGITLYELANLSTVWVMADIYESEVAAVTVNQSATASFAAYPGEAFQGKVAYIYPSLNAEARTVRMRLELRNPGLKLKPGMYGNVTLHTEAIKTLVVPKEAILETGLRQLVFVDRGEGHYEQTAVKLGRRSQDSVEVLAGLKEGDRIVTSANFLLDAESKLVSASSMQAMMGRVGMADWQMRGAYENKTEGMQEMQMKQGMPGMEPMAGMNMGDMKEQMPAQTRQSKGLSLTLTTVPEKPKVGDVLLRLTLSDQAGKPIPNAQVLFIYTMPMPGMTDSKATAQHTKDGVYESTVMFGMGGTWVVTVTMTVPGRPPVREQFQVSIGGGM